ncbi:MAG: GerMN domain-containing protein [Firmicutes bacterium]|nr:GerMN domain-containing protein [Bacillota bacterium]
MLNKKSKLIAILSMILIVTCIFSFAGCSESENQSNTGGDSPSISADQDTNTKQPEDPADKDDTETKDEATYALSMSFANEKYIETGDASQHKLVRKVKGEVKLDGGKNDEAAIKAAIEKLRKVPSSASNADTLVTDKFKINKVVLDGDKCNVDISIDNVDDLNQFDEQFFIYQVTDTVLSSFSNVKSVSFTVDGDTSDVLNYMDISSAFTADSVSEFDSSEAE